MMPIEIREAESIAHRRDKYKILIVEDDQHMGELIVGILSRLDAEVIATKKAQTALDCLESEDVAVVITDLKMPTIDGLEVLKFAKKCNAFTQVIMITGYATVESAVEALKSGAYDYLRKPFEPEELRHVVERALEHFRLSQENLKLRAKNVLYEESYGLIGQSPLMEKVRRMIDACAANDCSVLITGESGVGKEIVAQRIHLHSTRKDNRFVALNCAAIAENIMESELFGYQKGGFTGAERNKPGLLESADGGTLFLDEINNSSLSMQAKLLRFLQDGSFFRIGETDPRIANVRVVAATNRDLVKQMERGEFRDDLYYRLKVIEINIPPLRERRADIALLANYFLKKVSTQLGKGINGLSTRVLGAFMRHNWPGNVRELENVVTRMAILTETGEIDVDVLPPELSADRETGAKAIDYISPHSLEEIEAYFIAKTLRETKGNRSLAAEILGIDKSTLWRKIKRYNLAEESP
jgi:DNA-binding NtrC family response regulator